MKGLYECKYIVFSLSEGFAMLIKHHFYIFDNPGKKLYG